MQACVGTHARSQPSSKHCYQQCSGSSMHQSRASPLIQEIAGAQSFSQRSVCNQGIEQSCQHQCSAYLLLSYSVLNNSYQIIEHSSRWLFRQQLRVSTALVPNETAHSKLETARTLPEALCCSITFCGRSECSANSNPSFIRANIVSSAIFCFAGEC